MKSTVLRGELNIFNAGMCNLIIYTMTTFYKKTVTILHQYCISVIFESNNLYGSNLLIQPEFVSLCKHYKVWFQFDIGLNSQSILRLEPSREIKIRLKSGSSRNWG